MSLNNLIYGIILRNSRKKQHWSQERLAQECPASRGTIRNIESGESPPSLTFREIFARTLSNPVLEYFPPYDIEQFPQRIRVRFEHEREAVRYFLKSLQQRDLDSLQKVYSLYTLASDQRDTTLMIVLDEYLHTRIMNAHPNDSTKSLVERYRQDYIEFFKVWVSKIDVNLDITLGQVTTHLEIFEGILERNQHRLDKAIDLHLNNSLGDFEQLRGLLMIAS